MFGHGLGSMILEGFSNVNDSVILCRGKLAGTALLACPMLGELGQGPGHPAQGTRDSARGTRDRAQGTWHKARPLQEHPGPRGRAGASPEP